MNNMILKIVLGQLRTLLAALAGYLVASGWLQAEYSEAFIAIVLYIAASAGSYVNKTRAADKGGV